MPDCSSHRVKWAFPIIKYTEKKKKALNRAHWPFSVLVLRFDYWKWWQVNWRIKIGSWSIQGGWYEDRFISQHCQQNETEDI